MNRHIIYIIFLSLLLFSCSKQNSISDAQKELERFYNSSTVDWALIDTLYYRPYNCDWSDAIGAQIASDFPMEYTSKYWHRLQNAKTYLHQQTLPLRIGASDEFIKQLNHTESALDTVFVRIVSQEYYMRIFVDCYEETMPQEIDKCFETLNQYNSHIMSTQSAQELHEQGVRYYYGNGVEADEKKTQQWFVGQYEYAGCGVLLLKIRFGKAFDYQAAKHHAKLAKSTKKNCYDTSKNKSLWTLFR